MDDATYYKLGLNIDFLEDNELENEMTLLRLNFKYYQAIKPVSI